MKLFALFVSALFAAVVLAACGGSGDSTAADQPKLEMSPAEIAKLPKARIEARQGLPPDKLVVHDLRRGSGAVMRRGDTMLIDWAEVPYGRELESRPGERQLKFTWGTYIKGWEDGLPGMRVGGRRELTVPPRLGDTGRTVIYVVDLLAIERGEEPVPLAEEKETGTSPSTKPASRRESGPETRMSRAEIAKLPPLTIPRQSDPPPRRMEVRDLREGSGATLAKQDLAEVRWFQVNYPEVQKRSRSGLYGPQLFGLDNTVKGWAVGLPGMKVGGRRELILPPNLVYPRWKPSWGYKPYVRIYVVDLIGVKPPS